MSIFCGFKKKMSCVLEALNSMSNKSSVAPPKPAPSSEEQVNAITPETVKLTQYASGLGCACKMKAPALMEVLHSVKKTMPSPSELIVGYDKADDASVYKLTDDIALVNTTDFFPPIVDNPRDYGRIAAANALSDVYAMGGKPITALSISTFPTKRLPLSIMTEIMQGAEEVASKAGCVIAGGHTLDISEPVFGLAVTGTVNPKLVKTNGSTAIRDKDILILTKPIGTGVVTTLLKKDKISKTDAGVEDVMTSMTTLNKRASEILCGTKNNCYVKALTDVTGYGLAGHVSELVKASSRMVGENASDVVIANINVDNVNFFPVSKDSIKKFGPICIPGGSIGNSVYAGAEVNDSSRDECSLRNCIDKTRPDRVALTCLVVDPQTSGGLLAVVDREKASEVLSDLVAGGVNASIIGEVRRLDGDACKKFAHSRYVVFSDNSTRGDYLDHLDNNMNVFDIMEFLAPGKQMQSQKGSSASPVLDKETKVPAISGYNEAPGMIGASHASTTIFIRNTTIGSGDPVLGKKLLLAHLAKLSQRASLGTVRRVIFMNTGVRIPLGLEDARYTPILKTLEEKGVDVCACGTCVEHYAYTQASLVCGRLSSADENLDLMCSPTENCITLC